MSHPSASRKALRLKLWLIFFSVLVGLVLCETYFRLFAPSRLYGVQYQSPQIHFFCHDDRLGWRGRPGAEGPFGSIDFLVRVKLDPLGNRSSTAPFVEDKANVLVLGDSFGWGWGVENHQLFSEVMMRGHPGLNVYNLSAPGYGTGQQFIQLAGFLDTMPGRHFEECVLLLCLENDFDDIVADERYSYPKPVFLLGEGGLELGNVPVPRTRASEFSRDRSLQQSGEISIGALNRLHTWNRLVTWRRYEGLNEHEAGPATVMAEDEAERRNLMAGLLTAMRDTCATRNTGFSVVVIHGRDPGPRLPWLIDFLEDEAIPALAFNRLGSRWRPRSLYLDPHLNAYGHEVLAREVAGLLGS